MDKKKCFKCERKLPLSQFYKHNKMLDGHLNKCKECTKIDVSSNYRNNIDHYKKYEKERFSRPERKAKVLEYQRNRRANHPEKQKAHRMVKYHLKKGTLKRPDKCSICNKKTEIEAHHEDYTKPLDVLWLCFKCHRKRHGQFKEIL